MNLTTELTGIRSAAIAGHLRPDGDAVGSCLGLYHYLKTNMPRLEVTVYLEEIPETYRIPSNPTQIIPARIIAAAI